MLQFSVRGWWYIRVPCLIAGEHDVSKRNSDFIRVKIKKDFKDCYVVVYLNRNKFQPF